MDHAIFSVIVSGVIVVQMVDNQQNGSLSTKNSENNYKTLPLGCV